MNAIGLRLGLGAGVAAWWSDGVAFAADFGARRIMSGGRRCALNEAMDFARSSAGSAMSKAGLCTDFAAGMPRLTDGGLLLEGAATNVLRFSSGLGETAAWTAEGNAAVSGNAINLGGLVLEECAVTAPGAFPRFVSTDALSLADGEYGVISFYAMAGAASSIRAQVFDGTGATATDWTAGGGGFSKQASVQDNPAVTQFVADGMERFDNGVCRLWTTFRNVSGGPLAYRAEPHVAGTAQAPAMGSACWLGGVQLEKGRWPTSLIVTSGAPATRAADRLTMTPEAAGLGAAPSFAFSARWLGGDPAFPWLFSLNDGSAANEIGMYVNVGQSSLNRKVVAGGVTQADDNSGLIDLSYGDRIAASMRVAGNDLKTYGRRNGGAVVESSDASIVVSAISEVEIGAKQGGGSGSALLIERLASGDNLTDGQLEALVLL